MVKTLRTDLIAGWVVDVDGYLTGLFKTADEAAEWMAWEDEQGLELHGSIRAIQRAEIDDEDDGAVPEPDEPAHIRCKLCAEFAADPEMAQQIREQIKRKGLSTGGTVESGVVTRASIVDFIRARRPKSLITQFNVKDHLRFGHEERA